ncbi:MAG: hypothetical protein RSA66_06570 [Muribaculaceae bacterium]
MIFITNNLVVSGNCANTHSYLIDTFPTVREAQLNAIQAGASKEQMQKLIEKKNPQYENWAGRDIETLCRI